MHRRLGSSGQYRLRRARTGRGAGVLRQAVAVGESSIPEGFGGVLPWGLVDNRPFHRALYGLGLCAWRQRRWSEAEQIFTNRVWLEGNTASPAPWCRDAVRERRGWTRLKR